MNDSIYVTLNTILGEYGDAVFYNSALVKNLLGDLAPSLRKERIQIVNFLEIGGFFQLKYADKSYAMVRAKLEKQLVETYAIDRSIAMWVLDVFSKLQGYNIRNDGAIYEKTLRTPKREVIVEKPPTKVRPYIGDERRPLMKTRPPSVTVNKPNTPFVNLKFAKRISADYHTVAVVKGGLVAACGPNSDGQCNTNTYDWKDVTQVSAGAYYTVGLRANGTVVGAGRDDFGQRDFRGWSNIVQISAGVRHTVGLRGDGSVLAAGFNKFGECNVKHWRNIVRVIAGQGCTFGIKKDGRVLVAGDNKDGSLQVSHLEGVADIAYAAPGRILAHLQNGTVARVGRENTMRRNFTLLKGIKQLSAAPDYFAGLMFDGSVRILTYFWKNSGAEAVAMDWKEIVAIAAGRYHIIGWRADGKVLAEMISSDMTRNRGQTATGKWEM